MLETVTYRFKDGVAVEFKSTQVRTDKGWRTMHTIHAWQNEWAMDWEASPRFRPSKTLAASCRANLLKGLKKK